MLRSQFATFQRIYSVQRPAFEVTQGHECLRVAIHESVDTSRFVNFGYSPETLGFSSQRQLRDAITKYLTEELHLVSRRHKKSYS